jgi:hypothetical protein
MDKIVYAWFNNEKTALLCTYRDENWTWEDFHHAFEIQKAMIDEVAHPKVHIVVDARKSRLMPKGGSLLSGARKLTDLKHPRQGHTIVVGATGIVATIAGAIGKILGKHRQEFHLVKTMGEANALLAELIGHAQQKKTS